MVVSEYDEEARQALETIISSSGADRKKAARHLSRLGVWTRGSVLPRGSPGEAASNRLPEPKRLAALIQCIGDSDSETACQIIQALGHWGDEQAVTAVIDILRNPATDETVRSFCVTALTAIGGPIAVDALMRARHGESSVISAAAAVGLCELQTGGVLDYTEGITAQDLASAKTKENTESKEQDIAPAALPGEALVHHGLSMVDPERGFHEMIDLYEVAWEDAGLDVKGLLRSGPIPQSLIRAAQMLGQQSRENRLLVRNAMNSEFIWCPSLAYGPQNSWSGAVYNLCREIWGDHVEHVDERSVYTARARHIGATTKIVFPYPFFATASTADFYCVLPLGVQTSIGIIIPNALDALALEASTAQDKQTNSILSAAVRGKIGQAAIAKIFGMLIDNTKKKCAFRIGYAVDEILLDILGRHAGASLSDRFINRMQPVDVSSDEYKNENHSGCATAVPVAWTAENGVFLFDPANPPTDDFLKQQKAKKFVLGHGLDIPVGLGFTFPMLAELANQDARNRFFHGLLGITLPKTEGIHWFDRDRLPTSPAKSA